MSRSFASTCRPCRGSVVLAAIAAALALGASPLRAQAPADSLAPPPSASDSTDVPVPGPVPAPVTETVADPTALLPYPEGAATPNASPKSTYKVRLIGEGRNVVRSGPGPDFALAATYDKGAVFTVIAKSGPWYNIRLSDSETGWVHSDLCAVYEDMADLEFRPNPKLYTRTGSYVLTAYTGGYAFDRKSNSLVLGARLGYYIFDRVQAEAGLSWTHINRPAEIVETLFGLTLEAEKFHMLFYNLNITYEILPGRQMVPFVTVGAGSSIMRGDTEPSFNFGAGTQLFLSKRLATRWEVRDYRFSTGNGTSRVSNDNIEFSIGTSYLF